jgi:endonuclease/exonuclease/phosphatase family metal-dependent hydrolase|tara:strand:+ start:648 stop:1760 length:1113 start_codon:yes stop_codon:yes gene_type:complete
MVIIKNSENVMPLITRILKFLTLAITGLLVLGFIVIYSITFHPEPVEQVDLVCPAETPMLLAGQSLKVLSYNMQYFAGKDYVFYYDLENDAGPDTRPSPKAIKETLTSMSALIKAEDPDILLLQELHDGAKATDFANQTQLLLAQLNNSYPCYSEAFYWKADFVPHPSIMGSVGMKLVTLSKYKIDAGQRHQLSLMDNDPVTQAFNLKRAVLVTEFPVEGGGGFIAMNTHLDAFSQGMDTMTKQVAEVDKLLASAKKPWIIGGDFNLLPPGEFSTLAASQQSLYNPESEISLLINRYASVPAMSDIQGEKKKSWYTHYPNDPGVEGPDRTIDYIFYDDNITLKTSSVIHGESHQLSDHLPVTAIFQLPNH